MVFDELKPYGWLREKMAIAFPLNTSVKKDKKHPPI